MNFLAHIYLSAGHEQEMVGNFIGDFVKGQQLNRYPDAIGKGIRLHRQIDAYTDAHPIFRQSTALLRPYCGKYAGVATDVYYDHFLAANWEDFHPDSLQDFSADFYTNINQYYDILPERVQQFLPYMETDNWLIHYATFYGMERSLSGIDRRTGGRSGLSEGVTWLKEHYDELYSHFQAFFPILRTFVNQYRNT